MIRDLFLKINKTRNKWFYKTLFLFEVLLLFIIVGGILLIIIVL